METVSEYQFTVSTVAVEQIKKQLDKRGTPNAFLRLGIRGGGCSGFTYILMFEDSPPRDKDILFEVQDVQVIIDKKSIIYLNGCSLDWENTLMKRGFKFVNPNEKSTCGCGHSFTV